MTRVCNEAASIWSATALGIHRTPCRSTIFRVQQVGILSGSIAETTGNHVEVIASNRNRICRDCLIRWQHLPGYSFGRGARGCDVDCGCCGCCFCLGCDGCVADGFGGCCSGGVELEDGRVVACDGDVDVWEFVAVFVVGVGGDGEGGALWDGAASGTESDGVEWSWYAVAWASGITRSSWVAGITGASWIIGVSGVTGVPRTRWRCSTAGVARCEEQHGGQAEDQERESSHKPPKSWLPQYTQVLVSFCTQFAHVSPLPLG